MRRIFFTEYCAWGSLAALTGVLLAGVAGWALVTQLFELRFRLPALPLLGVWVAVVGLVAAVGLANSRTALSKTPLAVWRELSE